MKESQINHEGYRYNDETNYAAYEILFEYFDFLDCTVDKYNDCNYFRNFQLTTKLISSDIMVKTNYVANVDCTLLLNIPFDYLDFTLDNSVKTT